MDKQSLKIYVKKAVREAMEGILKENQPAPSRETNPGETETIPDRDPKTPTRRRFTPDPDKIPDQMPTRMRGSMNENERELIQKIITRYKSGK